MLGLQSQVWVTSALSEEEVEMSLILCYSLRRVHTTRKIAMVASSKISLELRQALERAFDFVFFMENDKNTTAVKIEDYVKLYCFIALRSFDKCVYLAPTLMAIKNSDDIFDKHVKDFILQDSTDTSVFAFKPSIKLYETLTAGLKRFGKIEHDIGEYLRKWLMNQHKVTGSIDQKYHFFMKRGTSLIATQTDIALINMLDYSSESAIYYLEERGIVGKLVAAHWLRVRNNDVLPLLSALQTSLASSNVSLLDDDIRKYDKEPIAIVGMSCRYPGSNSLEEFWDLLFQGKDATSIPPPFRWRREQCLRNLESGRKESGETNAGFLKYPVDEFDAKFFGISPKEVQFMDPQHRLLHELVREGLEDACIDPKSLHGTSGSVFIGHWTSEYRDILGHLVASEFFRGYMGNSIGAAAARISFLLGMTGPSIATESGCSSAIVAVHLACRSLLQGESNLALAGGVNLILHPFKNAQVPMVVSKDGRCKSFSEDADGFARAEGGGILVLKRLSDAVKEGDNVWGLIRGSAVCQEGLSKSFGTPTVACESSVHESS